MVKINNHKLSVLLVVILIQSGIAGASANAPDSTVYDPGTLNIHCVCSRAGIEKASWHHVIEVPREGFEVDPNAVCKVTRNNYDEPEVGCRESDEFVGEEFSYDPA